MRARGQFFSQISPHLKLDTIRKIHTPTVEFSVIGSDFKASMLVKIVHVHVFCSVPSCTMATPLETRKTFVIFGKFAFYVVIREIVGKNKRKRLVEVTLPNFHSLEYVCSTCVDALNRLWTKILSVVSAATCAQIHAQIVFCSMMMVQRCEVPLLCSMQA